MRTKPDLKSKQIQSIKYKDQVQILEEQDTETNIHGIKGRWVRVKFKDKEGWVFGGYLSPHSSFLNHYRAHAYYTPTDVKLEYAPERIVYMNKVANETLTSVEFGEAGCTGIKPGVAYERNYRLYFSVQRHEGEVALHPKTEEPDGCINNKNWQYLCNINGLDLLKYKSPPVHCKLQKITYPPDD